MNHPYALIVLISITLVFVISTIVLFFQNRKLKERLQRHARSRGKSYRLHHLAFGLECVVKHAFYATNGEDSIYLVLACPLWLTERILIVKRDEVYFNHLIRKGDRVVVIEHPKGSDRRALGVTIGTPSA